MNGMMSVGRSRAKQFSEDRPRTTFADVAGYQGVKQEINEVVEFLKNPGSLPRHRGDDPQGDPAGRPARHRQDDARARGGRRGRGPVLLGLGVGLHGDVRGRGREPGPRPLQHRAQAGAGHRLRRRDRLHRPQARRRTGRGPRRARADPQPDAQRDGRLRVGRGRRRHGRDQPARRARPGAAAPGPLRPPDRRAAARPRGARADPPGPHQVQADGPERRPGDGGSRDVGHERRRPGQPGQRGRAARGAPRLADHRDGRLRDRARPGPHGPGARHHGAQRRRARAHRVPRVRPRAARLRPGQDRPAAQDHDHPARDGARRHDDPARGGPPHHAAPGARGLPVHAHGRARRRAPRLRRPLDGRGRRPAAQHRPGAPDGARVGDVARDRPDGLGVPAARSSSARTSCTPATTPTTRRR